MATLTTAGEFLDLLATNQVDFTIAFRRLSDAADDAVANDELARPCGQNSPGLCRWWVRLRERLAREQETVESRRMRMRAVNPAFIPRNHRIEEMIEAANSSERLRSISARFYRFSPGRLTINPRGGALPATWSPRSRDERVCQTFCGT